MKKQVVAVNIRKKGHVMRLGEIKSELKQVLDNNNKITVKATQMYGGQLYKVDKFNLLIKSLKMLHLQKWNNLNFSNIDSIIKKYDIDQKEILLENPDYSNLQRYISELNQFIPVFYGILETMVPDQDEHIINIKLSDTQVQSLTALSGTNKDLETLLKTITVDGDYVFKGFDVGTSWYMILITGGVAYKLVVAVIDLAQKFCGAVEKFYNAKEARLHYLAALKKEPSEKELEEYVTKVVDLKLDVAIEDVVTQLGIDPEDHECKTKVKKAVNLMIKQMNNGTEFHLSLNPPKYATEINGKITINYEEIRAINAEEVPQIEHKEDEE
ncbi:MAG: hypothetical protein IKS08_04965 [Alphaproteobacteria bacterium]|nr:hypothetical protein [Alphaproteobacteria bacterium]